MTIKEYQAKCSAIHEELMRIAERTRIMACANCANPNNPEWVTRMDRHDVLLAELKRLDSLTPT